MITIIQSPTCRQPRCRPEFARPLAGFTLVEVLISSALASAILAAVLSTFLFLGRSGANMANYTSMESEARKALELFAEDTRQGGGVIWNSATSLTLVVNNLPITYAYNATARTFTRTYRPLASSTATQTVVLVNGITDFNFLAYTITGAPITDFTTAAARAKANVSTKQVQLSLSASRTATTVTAATNIVLSARYVLRNRKVTA